MAAWRRLPSTARGGLIAAVSGAFCAAATILLTAAGGSDVPSSIAPRTVTVTAAPDAAGLEPVPPAPKDRFGDSPEGRGFNVGTDVLAGDYTSKAPRDGESCVWQRLRADAHGVLVRVSDGRREGSAAATFKIGDVVVTNGCDWVRKP